MFNLKDAIQDITVESIFNKISEIEIWRRYCSKFKEIDVSFCSDLYNDKNPDCRIYYNQSNKLVFKDHGNGDSHDCFSYIQAKYHCTFKESLKIIYNDFNIGLMRFDIIPQLVLNNASEVLKMSNKSNIEIVTKPWSLVDYNYWWSYQIPLTLLDEYDVFPCETVYLHKNGKTVTFTSTKINPIYAYRFCFDGKYSYKIYFPLHPDKKRRWLFSGGSENDIEGFDQLPHFGDILILTKSLKDCISFNICGYPAISLQGEANKLKQDLVDKLYKRFNNIVVCYDNDEAGIKGTNKLVLQYNFKFFFIEGEKDLSDFIKLYGLEEAKQLINNKIYGLYSKE